MNAWDVATAATYAAQATALLAFAVFVARVLIAGVDLELNRRRSRRADGVTDIEPRAYADAVRRLHRSAR